MKKTILTIALGLAFSAQAQLTVLESGQSQFGTLPSVTPTIDKTATLNIWGLTGGNKGGFISFGQGSNAMIGGDGGSGLVVINASNGIQYATGQTSVVFSYTKSTNLFSFTSNVKAPAFLTTSDARFKSNVESLDDSFLHLSDLNAVSYNIAVPTKAVGGYSEATKDSGTNADTSLETDTRTHFGFIAQEVQKVYPNLVVKDEDGMLSIDYTGFIPLLVDAVKNLTTRVHEQEETIAMLTESVSPSRKTNSITGVETENIVLMQNRPNPFNTATTIECTLPEKIKEAFLCIYDLQGKQVSRIGLTERGLVSTVIDASTLQPGMYIYSLIADGNEINSKRMILTD